MHRIALILLTFLSGLPVGLPAASALACSRPAGPPRPPDLAAWIEAADRIYVGRVVSERPAPGAPPTPVPTATPDRRSLPLERMPEPATIARYRAATATAAAALPRLPTGTPDPYRAPEDATPSVSGLDHIRWPSVSTVQLVAVLKGQSPPGAFDVAHLGTLRSDCSGGPRLLEGDRVVLLFREGYPLGSSGDAGLGLLWSGALVLRDGAALYRQFGVSIPAGDAVDAVQEIALRAGAPADQRERAVRFAQGIDPGAARGTPLSPQAVAAPAGATPPARGSAGERAAWPAFSEVGLLALALSGGTTALVLLFRRRLHSP